MNLRKFRKDTVARPYAKGCFCKTKSEEEEEKEEDFRGGRMKPPNSKWPLLLWLWAG
jgi:hypothetical protein